MTVVDQPIDQALEPGSAAEPLTAIEVHGLSKQFRKSSEPSKTLKERLLTLRHSTVNRFDALSNLDFDVKMGESFGILGHNGSGKSTLLKCISGTIRPTEGIVRVRGSLSALLELGAGFHPDLTGRENIFLNASILGFSKQQVTEIFDDIVEFSGLIEFIDSQVKHYSSGMYARLGFAVSVNLEPDVLLVDEVLAVGDEAFQRKCYERIRKFQASGRTICLVTHSPDIVRQLCDRAMVLDHGNVIYLGEPDGAVAAYRRSLNEQTAAPEPEPADVEPVADAPIDLEAAPATRILSTSIDPPHSGQPTFSPGDQVTIRVQYQTSGTDKLRPRIAIQTHDGHQVLNASSNDLLGEEIQTHETGTFVFTIDDLPLMDGHYLVTLILQSPDETIEYGRDEENIRFEVKSNSTVFSRVRIGLSISSMAGETGPQPGVDNTTDTLP